MAATEEWRSAEKRRAVISQIEEAIRQCPTVSPQFQNPVEVEKNFFEKSRSQEEYQGYFHKSILLLTKHRAMHSASQQPTHQQTTQLHPAGMRGPMMNTATIPGMNPNQAMRLPGYPPPYQSSGMVPTHMVHQPQPQPHPQSYATNMHPVMAGMPPQRHGPTMIHHHQPIQPGQHPQHNSYIQTHVGGYPMPQRQPGIQMRPMQTNQMVQRMVRPTVPVGPTMPVRTGIPGQMTTMSMQQGPGMPMGMRQPMSQYGHSPHGFIDTSVQSVTAVPNPSYSLPGSMQGGMRPPHYTTNPPMPTASSGIQMSPRMNQGVNYSYGSPSASPVPAPVPSTPSTSSTSTTTTITSASEPTSQTPPSQSQPPTSSSTSITNPTTPRSLSQSVPSPSPATPLLPASPAMGLGSPAQQPIMTPEENEAYFRKFAELQKYIPLLARMITKLSKQQGDDRRSDQYTKLRNLYNLLQDQTRRVPLPTLWKCGQALEKIFDPKTLGEPELASHPSSNPSLAATLPPSVEPLLPPVRPPPEPSKSQSLMEFKMIPSPPPTVSNLLATIHAKPLPLDGLPPRKRHCNREAPTISPGLMRELAHLEHFKIQQRPQPDIYDKTTILECSLVDDGLPQVPSLTIRIPPNYPHALPECDLSHYNSNPFLRNVSKLLSDKLSKSYSGYTLSSLLTSWESCVLRAMAKELSSQEEY